MARINIKGIGELDSSNVSGAKLAEIGKAVLEGKKLVDDTAKKQEYYLDKERRAEDYTDIVWLNIRIEEVCRKGRI